MAVGNIYKYSECIVCKVVLRNGDEGRCKCKLFIKEHVNKTSKIQGYYT